MPKVSTASFRAVNIGPWGWPARQRSSDSLWAASRKAASSICSPSSTMSSHWGGGAEASPQLLFAVAEALHLFQGNIYALFFQIHSHILPEIGQLQGRTGSIG